jgi:hypothetical protein
VPFSGGLGVKKIYIYMSPSQTVCNTFVRVQTFLNVRSASPQLFNLRRRRVGGGGFSGDGRNDSRGHRFSKKKLES